MILGRFGDWSREAPRPIRVDDASVRRARRPAPSGASAVQADPELDLQIRHHYVNIYYRGSNLMEIRESGRGGKHLRVRFDRRYLPGHAQERTMWNPPPNARDLEVEAWLQGQGVLDVDTLRDAADVQRHVASFAYRKEAMDASKVRRPKKELETQQAIVRCNNTSDESEYLVCDTEYSFLYEDPAEGRCRGRIDLIAAYRSRSVPDPQVRLVFIELKYGANAIDGKAGLQKHVRDICGLLGKGDLGSRAEEFAGLVEAEASAGAARQETRPV